MLSQFPIFLYLHQTLPLVIGDDSGLAAKLRLWVFVATCLVLLIIFLPVP
jgi:hypothetical protein